MGTLSQFMSQSPVTVQSSATLSEAARLMRDHDIGMLPVLEGSRLIGIVTDRDIVVRGMAQGAGDGRVETVVTRDVVIARPDDDAMDVARIMSQSDIRRLPVFDADRLVGVVSVGDLAVRAEESLAGGVMKHTGPQGDRHNGSGAHSSAPREGDGAHWPGAEMVRNQTTNEAGIAGSVAQDDIIRDISQAGVSSPPRE